MKFLNTVYHNDGKIAIDTKNPPEFSGGFESQQLFAFLDSSLWCYAQKGEIVYLICISHKAIYPKSSVQ